MSVETHSATAPAEQGAHLGGSLLGAACCVLLLVGLAACDSAQSTIPPTVAAPPSENVPTGSAPSEPMVTGRASIDPAPTSAPKQPSCELRLPDALAGSTIAPGPAYLLAGLRDSQLVRIGDDGVTVILPPVSPKQTFKTNLVGRPDGKLWISDWESVRVLEPSGSSAALLRQANGGELYDHLIVLSPTDAWAVTSAIEWEVLHYDGQAWKPVGRRADFRGKFDDNKFSGLAVTGEGTWVGSWNGLWRGVGRTWQRIDGPGVSRPGESDDGPFGLHVYRGELLAAYRDGLFLRQGGAWRKLDPPLAFARLWAVSDTGLWAGQDTPGGNLVLASAAGGRCVVSEGVVRPDDLRTVTIDGSARAWVTTDDRLLVLDRGGRLLASYSQGTLDGFVGRPGVVAVTRAGPSRLPAARVPETLDLVGKLETFKSHAALSGATLELCASLRAESGCRGAAFSRSTVSRPDGTFLLADVPEGEYWIRVTPPDGLEDCRTPFHETGIHVMTIKDCAPGARQGRTCDLGTDRQCWPFEMPLRR